MIRQNIILGDYIYLIDLYKVDNDITDSIHYDNFVMLKNYNIINNIAQDTDIYFIDKSIFDKCLDSNTQIIDYDKLSQYIVFPNLNNNRTRHKSFSTSILDFNENYSKKNFSYQTDIYPLLDSESNLISIKCDKVRIYNPIIKSHTQAVIHIDNYMNDIHFHYLCSDWSIYKINSETEIEINHTKYSEFIELYIPNIETLFSGDVYYKDNFNFIYDNNAKVANNLIPLSLILNPFRIDTDNKGRNVKNYLPLSISIKNNYLTVPVNITLFPYSEIDDKSHLYLIDDILEANTDTFTIETKFKLKSHIGFDNGKISLINIFDFPGRQYYSNVYEAYYTYNRVTKNDYILYTGTNEEYDNELYFDNTFDKCGFVIQIASDTAFTSIVYKYSIKIDETQQDIIDDFSFQLDNIFNSWNSWNGILYARAIYIDKMLSTIISSNTVLITKEVYKYIINESRTYRLENLSDLQIDINENMDLKHFNFIDKINCVVNKQETGLNGIFKGDSNMKILYKPVFYRVGNLQSIKIRKGLTQNIGINLSDFMTKVESFRLVINDYTYEEFARNDVYVIFKLTGTHFLEYSSGQYDILNQDNEFISTGNYTVY